MKITLATLSTATAQQVFDHVATHLLTQGEKSRRYQVAYTAEACAYRGEDGLKCAAGCLIADDEYKYDMEGRIWPNLVNGGFASANHADLIHCLQVIHDHEEIEDWYWHLKKTAAKFKLETTVLQVAR